MQIHKVLRVSQINLVEREILRWDNFFSYHEEKIHTHDHRKKKKLNYYIADLQLPVWLLIKKKKKKRRREIVFSNHGKERNYKL